MLALLASTSLPAIWRAEAGRAAGWPEWWVRGLPTAVFVGWVMLLSVPLAVLGPKQHGTAEDVFVLLLAIVSVMIVLGALVWVTVLLFGWPRFAVPSQLRRRASR
jgi:hypothetical protein